MLIPCRMNSLALITSLLLSLSAIADQPQTPDTINLDTPVLVAPPQTLPVYSYSSWSESASKTFYSSAKTVTLDLHPPQQFREIKFQTNTQLQLESAQVFGHDNKKIKLSYQSPSPTTESATRTIPLSLGPITKIIITYKNPGKSQGTITMLGRRQNS